MTEPAKPAEVPAAAAPVSEPVVAMTPAAAAPEAPAVPVAKAAVPVTPVPAAPSEVAVKETAPLAVPAAPAITPSIINEKAASETPAVAEAAAPELKPEVKPEAAPATNAAAAMVAEKPAPTQVAELTKPETVAPEAKPPVVAGTSRDPVVNIETADGEMAGAMAKARASLPEFWTKLEQPGSGESDFSLKVAIEGRNAAEVEHFWLTGISRKDGRITGTISNDPSTVKTVRRGQSYVINPEKISDWMYKRNGKMVGNETMRPLLKRLPAQQAASYRDMYETP